MKRRGFTLVELMTVISIISVLLTIVVTSVSGSMKTARSQRAQAGCAMVQSGLATYYAQYDKWPEPLGSRIASGSFQNEDTYELSAEEVRRLVFELVKETKEGNPMIDVSVLYVAHSNNEKHGRSPDKKVSGRDFFQAVHGTSQKEYSHRMKVSQMYFGYPDPETGYFVRYRMIYSIPSDQLTVTTF